MKKNFITITIILVIFLLFSCKYKFKIEVYPEDATITIGKKEILNNEIYETDNNTIYITCSKKGYKTVTGKHCKKYPFGKQNILIELEKKEYFIKLTTLYGASDIYIGSKKISTTPHILKLKYGIHNIILKRKGFPDQQIKIEANSNNEISFCHKKDPVPITQIGVFTCGSLPKQIIYSPDDKYIYIPVLGGLGFNIFNTKKLKIEKSIITPDKTKSSGFPEGLFIKEKMFF